MLRASEYPGHAAVAHVRLNEESGRGVEVLADQVREVVVPREVLFGHQLVFEEQPLAERLQASAQCFLVALFGVHEEDPRIKALVASDRVVDPAWLGAFRVPCEPVAAPDVARAVGPPHRFPLQGAPGGGPDPGRDPQLRARRPLELLRRGDVVLHVAQDVDAQRAVVEDRQPVLGAPLALGEGHALATPEVHELVEGVAVVRA
mmetsp:Transcript_75513/g.235101  ORF Transcript_75513/g.235101 Transcript_75513/m.235101 type:complete len:204 (-) Transcript_75513:425-1036(-)